VKRLGERADANARLICGLLRTSFTGAHISSCGIKIDGRKFKITIDGRRMFLCVSLNYLSDRRGETIRNDFDELGVREVLLKGPDQPFLLSNESVKQGALELISSAAAECVSDNEDAFSGG
jgi:hypothetical protein